MSQQPPYGSPEPQQPFQPPGQQPYTPYSQGSYPNPYGQFPQPPKSNTTRNVLLIVGGVVLLFCGGIVAFFAWVVSSADNVFDNEFPGSDDDPITVTEGEAFEIRGFEYASGWSITSQQEDLVITGLKTTNARDDDDSASVYLRFRFYRDNEQLATVSCSGVFDLAPERTATLDCSSYGEDVTGFDEIEVYDDSYSE